MAVGDPDPTNATEARIERAREATAVYIDGQIGKLVARLDAIDTATELLSETVNRVPTETQRATGNLKAIIDERFRSIEVQFQERDTRQERESRDNKVAVDAAFAAQKEAAAQQDASNQKAINKSEQATIETIRTLTELFRTTTDAIGDKLDDLKERVGRVEALRQGGNESIASGRAGLTTEATRRLVLTAQFSAMIAVISTIAAVVVAVVK